MKNLGKISNGGKQKPKEERRSRSVETRIEKKREPKLEFSFWTVASLRRVESLQRGFMHADHATCQLPPAYSRYALAPARRKRSVLFCAAEFSFVNPALGPSFSANSSRLLWMRLLKISITSFGQLFHLRTILQFARMRIIRVQCETYVKIFHSRDSEFSANSRLV